MFFDSFESIKEIFIISGLIYVLIIAVLRSSGKRTLLELTAFDFLVTLTIGSIVATTILSEDTTLADGMTALLTLVLIKFIISKANIHLRFVSKILKSSPTLLYHDGKYLKENMKKVRMTKREIQQEVRLQSGNIIENIDAVILESNGKISTLSDLSDDDLKTLFKELEDYSDK